MSLAVLDALDRLFAGVVTNPRDWTDDRMAEWMSEFDAGSIDREAVKILSRGVRRAIRLRNYWLARADRADAPPDWRLRVDEALGGEGWRVSLDLAMWSLRQDPDPCVFEVMAERFRWVKFQPYPHSYDEWVAAQ